MNRTPPSRPVSDAGRDDMVVPFLVDALDTRGRVVRLGPAIDAILKRHAYPSPIARVVGEG
jgi:molecular chaperone Hsp33